MGAAMYRSNPELACGNSCNKARPFGDSFDEGMMLPGKATPAVEADLSHKINFPEGMVKPAGAQDVLPAGMPDGRNALKSPRRIASVGTSSLIVRPVRGSLNSIPPKKKTLFLYAGPPTKPPKSLNRRYDF